MPSRKESRTSQFKQIIEGYVNDIVGRNNKLSNKRIEICKACPLYIVEDEPRCNSDLYLDAKTNEAFDQMLPGTVRGCGCALNKKTKSKDSHCPVNKW